MTTLTALLVAALGADLLGTAPGLELGYTGRLTPVAVSGPAAEKGFSIDWVVLEPRDTTPAESLYLLTEDAAAQPWTSRFGFCTMDARENAPQIGYRFADRDHTLPLPGIVVPHVDRLLRDREAIDGPVRYDVVSEKQVAGRDCLMIETSTNRGREATLAVEKSTGLIVTCRQSVVLGRGDRFLLSLDLARATPFDDSQAARHRALADRFRRIASAVARVRDGEVAELAGEELTTVANEIAPLTANAQGTVFESFAAVIARNLNEQKTRTGSFAALEKKIVGSTAPPLELRDLDGKAIDAKLLDGRVVVLHFWDYDRDALEAPYGQIGYLDFLQRRRAADGVVVIGVAVNRAFAKPESRHRAARSAKKLREFMNIDYPLAGDDGTLIGGFGDPRPLGIRLPLWVVFDSNGIVRVFKSGLYDVEPNDGLKELDSHLDRFLSPSDSAP